jgi:uridylate kinase
MKYKRVLLKLSGESIGGRIGVGLDENILAQYAREIHDTVALGVEIAIVIGGGNIFRGLSGVGKGFDRVKGDQMGMLATIINSIALSMALKSEGTPAEVFTSTPAEPYGIYYGRDKAVKFMESGGVSIIAGGTGNPFFTTDTASALRAAEIGAEALLKGTRVDGVYSADPEKFQDAFKYTSISFDKALEDNLKVMDLTAFTLCKENSIPIVVFDVNIPGNLVKVVNGENIGTLVSDDN